MAMWGDESAKMVQTAGQALGVEYVRTRQMAPNLKAQRQKLQLRIDKIDKLLNLLEKHPEMVQVIDLSRELL